VAEALGAECTLDLQETEDEVGLQRSVFECVAAEIEMEVYTAKAI